MPAEFDKLRKAIKQQLKKDNPNMSNDDLEQKSFAIATSQWKKSHGGKAPSREEVKYDEDGDIIVAENIKFYIDSSINTIEE